MKKYLLLGLWLLAAKAYAFQTLFIVRHAEKQDESKDPALSLNGKGRALDLAAHLKDAGIKAIYVTEYQRTQKTAEPLAEVLAVKPEMTDKDLTKFAATLLADKSSDAALIVGHSNTVPDLVKALGVPGNWTIADTEFDQLIIVTLAKPAPVATLLRY
jgi:phosphohistidine phosphatase SixA